MSRQVPLDALRIAEEAAQWMDALESGDPQTHSAFAAWLRASPRHIEEFLLLTASDRAFDELDAGQRIDVDALIAQLPNNVVSLQGGAGEPHSGSTPAAPRSRSATGMRWAASISALGLSLLAVWMWSTSELRSWQPYATTVGEQRSIGLPDGSLLQLNARSRVEVRLSSERRDIRLLEGEALFKVAHDATRPFQVHADNTVVRAIGTQFNVRRGLNDTVVSVIEGRVQVSRDDEASTGHLPALPELLGAGEQARVVPDGQVTRLKVNPQDVGVWRQRRLVFRDSTLGEIADEFNRYNRAPKIIVADVDLRARRFGGTFDADDPQALVRFLRAEPDLTFESQGSTLVIRPSPAASQ
ncbi:FecR family protein [Peristeroidobacter soli]|uniref:FecR family protein n=1 Tax=Peristeroidobacter soli TaxID=2497877 RepID=UPI001589449B|nr:FecR domain-containing protein [Peristeroidobacter soli]